MALSSDTLTHYTRTLQSLKGILRHTFKVKYCRETLYSSAGHIDFLIPLVSFCDIPFSQILDHVKRYGSYGIGLSKSWAHKKGLNPVLYVEGNSSLANTFYPHFIPWVLDGENKIIELSSKKKAVLNILRYMKNFQGSVIRKDGRQISNYRFSNEREWRYVLPISSTMPMMLECKKKDESRIAEKKSEVNLLIQDYLSFGPNDIKYIIIKNEKERDSIIKSLRDIKDAHDQSIIDRLASRIVSIEQIKMDF